MLCCRSAFQHSLLLAVVLVPLAGCESLQRASPGLTSFTSAIAGMRHLPGLFDLYLDDEGGRVLMLLPREVEASEPSGFLAECLYVEGLTTGLGSNDVGLDRGQLGPTRVVQFRRLGPRVLIEESNQGFRAQSANASERRAARESFATSVLWSGEVLTRDSEGRILVDLTTFVVRDAHRVAGSLRSSGQGDYRLDESRSMLDAGASLAFPDNLELEALLTFEGSSPGRFVRGTAPSAESVSLVQHHSFVRLPDAAYQPRRHDPRSGSFAVSYLDYAAGLDQPLRVEWSVRHRLQKLFPSVERSRAREPIVYYVDRGAPEAVRRALLEGARWWAPAFEAAGFEDAFRVELLPEGVHPLDARYHVIQWVHRATRGWSYGGGVIDPRTGEMIKAHVTLGSLRVRHDRRIFEGLAGTAQTGSGQPHDPVELSLARLRQLSAHEVGHTLGFQHNFAASSWGGRASVMDYPAPWIGIENGELDFSRAYGVGIGEWDAHAVRWAYSEFPPGADEAALLSSIVDDGIRRGYAYFSDTDARPAAAAMPLASLWDNGSDAVDELETVLAVRRLALERFGEFNVMPGRPLAELREVLAPIYLYHRYQLEAAVKVVGGMSWSHALRGDGQVGVQPIGGDEQRRALASLMALLSPRELDLPERLLALLHPLPPGSAATREALRGKTAPAFDGMQAAAIATDMLVTALLQPERAARVVDFHRRDPSLPSFEDVLDAMIMRVFGEGQGEPSRTAELRRVIQGVLVDRLLRLARDETATLGVRGRVEDRLSSLRDELTRWEAAEDEAGSHARFLLGELRRHFERSIPTEAAAGGGHEPPPGMPIGGLSDATWACDCSWAPGS